jgi:hypothetical protein
VYTRARICLTCGALRRPPRFFASCPLRTLSGTIVFQSAE